ncbi:YIPF1 protein [Pelomyxa schiedti]|nr:YIPF1 protein [Pelomyxa schiedti]
MSGTNPFFEYENPFSASAPEQPQTTPLTTPSVTVAPSQPVENTTDKAAFNAAEVFGTAYNQPEIPAAAPPPQEMVSPPTQPVMTQASTAAPSLTFANPDFGNFQPATDYSAYAAPPGGDSQNAGFITGIATEPAPEPEPTEERKCHHFYKPSYYRPYFNVSTNDVLLRILWGVFPFPRNFFDRIGKNPDAYGPFWVSSTVLFLLASISNFASYFEYMQADMKDEWEYDFVKLSFAAGAVYIYVYGCSIVLWIVLKIFKVPLGLVACNCVYGYTMVSFSVATVMCLIPNNAAQWCLVMAATGWSAFVLVWSLMPPLLKIDKKKGIPTLVVVGLLQLALGLTFKLYFFDVDISPPSSSNS